MDLLDDNEAPLIKDGSPPPTDMDINVVFTLPIQFRGVEEEVAQMCLSSKEVVLKKPKESRQHLKTLYIRGHIDGKPISRMLIGGGAAVNLMLYVVFKNLGWQDNELVKTNLTLNDMGGNLMEGRGIVSMEVTVGANCSLPRSSSSRCKVTIALFLATIGFMPIAAFLILCINS
jgi:hypothetical protein